MNPGTRPARSFPEGVVWFDEATHTSLIADYAQRFEPFLAEVADGMVDKSQLDRPRSTARRLDARSRAAIGAEAARQGDGIALRIDGV